MFRLDLRYRERTKMLREHSAVKNASLGEVLRALGTAPGAAS
jgi:hypothetical protein